MDKFAGYYPESHTSTYDVLDKIAVEVANNRSLSEFLRKFAEAWLQADRHNKGILQTPFLRLIEENGLEGAGRERERSGI